MAVRADFHIDVTLGGAGHELVSAGASHIGYPVIGMNTTFHFIYLQKTVIQNRDLKDTQLFIVMQGEIRITNPAGNSGDSSCFCPPVPAAGTILLFFF